MELPTINRYVHGERRPDPKTVLRINHALALLTGHPRVEDFLNFEAAACGLLQEERFEALIKGAAWCLRWYGDFFKPGANERLRESMNALDKAEKRKLLLGLNRALRRVVVSALLPSSTPVGFRAVLEAFEARGIDLKELVSEKCVAQLAWERFVQTVQHELAAQNPRTPARERLAATRRIVEALADPDVLAAIEVSTDGAAEGLREVKTTVNGAQVSRFFGDSRAAWAPFTPPTRYLIKVNNAPSVRRKGGHS